MIGFWLAVKNQVAIKKLVSKPKVSISYDQDPLTAKPKESSNQRFLNPVSTLSPKSIPNRSIPVKNIVDLIYHYGFEKSLCDSFKPNVVKYIVQQHFQKITSDINQELIL